MGANWDPCPDDDRESLSFEESLQYATDARLLEVIELARRQILLNEDRHNEAKLKAERRERYESELAALTAELKRKHGV